jgi:hypothetical protein
MQHSGESWLRALCRIARSGDSALCGMTRSQNIFANFSANSQPYAKKYSWKNGGSKSSWDCPFNSVTILSVLEAFCTIMLLTQHIFKNVQLILLHFVYIILCFSAWNPYWWRRSWDRQVRIRLDFIILNLFTKLIATVKGSIFLHVHKCTEYSGAPSPLEPHQPHRPHAVLVPHHVSIALPDVTTQ